MMKASQKFRVVIKGVHFYTTAKQIRNGVGDQYSVNAAIQKCLLVLETMRKNDNIPPVGLAGTWEGLQVQLDMCV
jgi:hypothetical protein